MDVLELKEPGHGKAEAVENSSGISRATFSRLITNFENIWFYLTLLLAAMLIALFILLLLLQKESTETERNYQRELRIQQMQNSLSIAVIDADRNDFEASRQTASDFFVSLESELALPQDSAFSDDQREIMGEILRKKTVINQLLAEKDPKASNELASICELYQTTVKGFQPIER